MKKSNSFRPNSFKCKLKFRYHCWPGFKRNELKFRYKQIYEALKMKGELTEWELKK